MKNLRVVSLLSHAFSRSTATLPRTPQVVTPTLSAWSAVLLMLVIVCGSAFGQNAGALAAQQAMQAAQEANQQAAQQAQLANQQAIDDLHRANEQAMQAGEQARQQMINDMDKAHSTEPTLAYTLPPSFSVKAGTVAAGTTVRVKSNTRYAVIYYTTNGWSPTTSSKRYEGPITINATTQLRAIAVAPYSAQSAIMSARYEVKGTQASTEPAALITDGVLRAGTHLHLVTVSTISSKTAQVGDDLKVTLNQDLKVGDEVVVPKGTPVEAIVTQADPAGHAGTPGNVSFEIKSLTVQGMKILLKGGESLEGANHYDKAKSFLVIPVVGLAGLAVRGDEAVITPGMTLTASVAADAPLHP